MPKVQVWGRNDNTRVSSYFVNMLALRKFKRSIITVFVLNSVTTVVFKLLQYDAFHQKVAYIRKITMSTVHISTANLLQALGNRYFNAMRHFSYIFVKLAIMSNSRYWLRRDLPVIRKTPMIVPANQKRWSKWNTRQPFCSCILQDAKSRPQSLSS